MSKIRHDEPARRWSAGEKLALLAALVGLFLMVLGVILGGLVFGAPPEAVACRLTGYVYGTADLAESAAVIAIPANCPIDVHRFERRLVLTSPRWRVEIEIPASGGWQKFVYTWGQDRAYIGAHEVPIVATPRELPT